MAVISLACGRLGGCGGAVRPSNTGSVCGTVRLSSLVCGDCCCLAVVTAVALPINAGSAIESFGVTTAPTIGDTARLIC